MNGCLLQLHSEYKRRTENADMLERHIIEARLKGGAADERVEAHILDEFGESYHQLGLPPGIYRNILKHLHKLLYINNCVIVCLCVFLVKSSFVWCVDNTLLRSHNLIYPQVYRPVRVPLAKAPHGKTTPECDLQTIELKGNCKKMNGSKDADSKKDFFVFLNLLNQNNHNIFVRKCS